MSLAEKWREYAQDIIFINEADYYASQRAFYAGAEAVLERYDPQKIHRTWAEIDHFRSHR